MKKILLIGAGLSTPSLIKYLLDNAEKENWEVIIADVNTDIINERIQGHPRAKALKMDIFNDEQRALEIKQSDIVISMLPARFHHLVAKCCIRFGKDMVTASYVSDEVKEMNEAAKEKGIILLNEIGLDPGIDHMSAMRVIDEIKESGAEMVSFRSSTGGLVAPRYDNNPWNYKFTWNPRNVVVAGQGGAVFIRKGMYKHIPYHRLFMRTDRIYIDGYGEFEVYPNRDSLKYREAYGLHDIPTMFRGTIRRPGYARTWNLLVQLGLTDDSFVMEKSEELSNRDFVKTFLRYERNISVEKQLAQYLNISEDSHDMYKLRWLGLLDDTKLKLKNATPAQLLQKILEEKWRLEPEDRDMIVMRHQFIFRKNEKLREIVSTMVVEGKDNVHTAMAQTVGLPVGIATKMILNGEIVATGIHIPTSKLIYEPVLKELEQYGIVFTEKEDDYIIQQ